MATKNKFSIFDILFSGLVVAWTLAGALRVLFPSFASYLYLLPVPFLLGLMLVQEKKNGSGKIPFRIAFSTFPFLLLSLLTLQSILVSLGFIQTFFSVIVYILPFLFFIYSIPKISELSLVLVVKVTGLLVYINLIYLLLQIFTKIGFFQTTNINESLKLTSSFGIVRATGTFTSPNNFGLFVIFSVAILIFSHSRDLSSRMSNVFQSSAISFLIAFSGNRGIILNLILGLAFLLLLPSTSQIKYVFYGLILVLMFLISFKLFETNSFFRPFYAFQNRIQTASQSENSIQRLIDDMTSFTTHIFDAPFFGDGLSSYSRVVLGYSSNNWIESELQKIITEAGPVFGMALISFRYFIAIAMMFRFIKYKSLRDPFYIFLFGSSSTTIIFGQVTSNIGVNIFYLISISILLNGLYFDSSVINHKRVRYRDSL